MPQKQPFLGAVVGAVLPTILAGAIEGAVRGAVQQATGSTSGTDTIAKDVVKRLEQNPAVVNQVNAEAPYQSRVAVGSVVSALGVIIPVLGRLAGWDIDGNYVVEVITAAMTLGGALYALYGRFVPGLKPLFSR